MTAHEWPLERLPLATVGADGVVQRASTAWNDSIGTNSRWAELFDDVELRALTALRETGECVVGVRRDGSKKFSLRSVGSDDTALVVSGTDVTSLHAEREALREERDSLKETLEFVSFQTTILSTLSKVMEAAPIILWSTDADGIITMHDGAGLARVNATPRLGKNIFEEGSEQQKSAIRRAFAGERSVTTDEPIADVFFETWHLPLRDENDAVSGVVGLSIDVTDRVRKERDNERQLALIASQNEVIRALASPILRVGEDILCVPLIGEISEARAAEIAESLLESIIQLRARFAILDVTGVTAVDAGAADALIRVVSSVRLLGVEAILSGVSPALAQTLVSLGTNLGGVRTTRSIRDAIARCTPAR